MAKTAVIPLMVTEEQREKMRRLAKVARELGLTEKPTVGALIELGLNVVWDECQRIWLQARDIYLKDIDSPWSYNLWGL